MKRSEGDPASICFASALLAPYDTTTLSPLAASKRRACSSIASLRLAAASTLTSAAAAGIANSAPSTIQSSTAARTRITVPQHPHCNISPYITVDAKKAPRAAGAFVRSAVVALVAAVVALVARCCGGRAGPGRVRVGFRSRRLLVGRGPIHLRRRGMLGGCLGVCRLVGRRGAIHRRRRRMLPSFRLVCVRPRRASAVGAVTGPRLLNRLVDIGSPVLGRVGCVRTPRRDRQCRCQRGNRRCDS